MSKCKWCDNGDKQHVLDEDGVLSSISGKPGVLSHSYDVYWWRCRNAPRKKRSGGQRLPTHVCQRWEKCSPDHIGGRPMKIECPWCHLPAGAYIPKGGDGSALRLRSHKNLWGGKCMGSGMLDTKCAPTQGREDATPKAERENTSPNSRSKKRV